MRVLIVDDEQQDLTVMQRMLSDCHDVDCASTADEAMEKAKQGDYDFVLLDFMVPEHDGLWLMSNCHFPRKTKVILVTGHLTRELVNQMFRMGISSYMMKPVRREDVLRQLKCLSKYPPDARDNSEAQAG